MQAEQQKPGPMLVALVHYAAPDWLRSSVRSLHQSDVAVHVMVVSNSGPVDIDDAEVISLQENLGYAGGANHALRLWLERFTTGDYFVIGSHDLHVQPDTLRLLRDALDADPSLGLVGPAMPDAARGQHIRDNLYMWLSGQCLMARRECIEEIGLFDERFSSYVEDVDLGLRAWDAGWRVALVDGAHAHGLGSANGSSRDLRRWRWSNQVGLARKRHGWKGGVRALCGQVVLAGLSFYRALVEPKAANVHVKTGIDRLLCLSDCFRAYRRFA